MGGGGQGSRRPLISFVTPSASAHLPQSYCFPRGPGARLPSRLGTLTPWNAIEGPSLGFSHVDTLLIPSPSHSVHPPLTKACEGPDGCPWIWEERKAAPPLGTHLLDCRVEDQVAKARSEAKRQGHEGRELPAWLTALSPGPSRAWGPEQVFTITCRVSSGRGRRPLA